MSIKISVLMKRPKHSPLYPNLPKQNHKRIRKGRILGATIINQTFEEEDLIIAIEFEMEVN